MKDSTLRAAAPAENKESNGTFNSTIVKTTCKNTNAGASEKATGQSKAYCALFRA